MSTPFLGEIRVFAFVFAPRGWALCDGRTIAINQNQALYSLLGNLYGGTPPNTFNLPDFRGRTPLHFGQGTGLPAFALAARGGEAAHALTLAEMPAHTHRPLATTTEANKPSAAGTAWAASSHNPYSEAAPGVALAAAALAPAGTSAGHPNEQPYLVLNFSIALQGIFPSRP